MKAIRLSLLCKPIKNNIIIVSTYNKNISISLYADVISLSVKYYILEGFNMERVKVLIVDDELLAIEDLIDLFDWQGNGFEIAGTAGNGEQALRKFQKLEPHIVITDIKMPIMNGIELARAIRKQDQNCRIIFLSGYAEFEYAKQALDLDVEDYILKNEINEESLRLKMLELKNKIKLDEQRHHLIQQRAVFDIFNAKGNIAGYIDSKDNKMADFIRERYHYFIIEEDQPLPLIVNLLPEAMVENSNISVDMMELCMNTSFEAVRTVSASNIRENRYILVISFPVEASHYSEVKLLKLYAHKLQLALEGRFQRTFSIFMMTQRVRIDEAYDIYTKFKSKIYLKYLLGTSILYDIDAGELKGSTDYIPYDEGRMQRMIDKGNLEGIFEHIDELFESIIKAKTYPGLVLVIRGILTTLEKNGSGLKSLKSGKGYQVYRLEEREDWFAAEKISPCLKKKFQELTELTKENSTVNYSKEVLKAMEFIRNNFSREALNIKEIAQYVCLSVTRISYLFKKETDNTIVDFLTNYRIEQAKELLKNGDLKVYEVGERVGYGSSQYFSQVFMKLTGEKPLDYKKRSD